MNWCNLIEIKLNSSLTLWDTNNILDNKITFKLLPVKATLETLESWDVALQVYFNFC